MFLQQMKDATPQANHQSDLRHLFAYRPDAMRHLFAFTQAVMPCALGRLGSPRGSRRATGRSGAPQAGVPLHASTAGGGGTGVADGRLAVALADPEPEPPLPPPPPPPQRVAERTGWFAAS